MVTTSQVMHVLHTHLPPPLPNPFAAAGPQVLLLIDAMDEADARGGLPLDNPVLQVARRGVSGGRRRYGCLIEGLGVGAGCGRPAAYEGSSVGPGLTCAPRCAPLLARPPQLMLHQLSNLPRNVRIVTSTRAAPHLLGPLRRKVRALGPVTACSHTPEPPHRPGPCPCRAPIHAPDSTASPSTLAGLILPHRPCGPAVQRRAGADAVHGAQARDHTAAAGEAPGAALRARLRGGCDGQRRRRAQPGVLQVQPGRWWRCLWHRAELGLLRARGRILVMIDPCDH